MYAVIQTGGKQFRVQTGDVIQVEKLDGEIGSDVKLDQVLLCAQPGGEKIWIGKPHLAGANVEAEIVGQGRGEKILIIKMKRRKQYHRTQGHRQNYTQLLIKGIHNGAGDSTALDAKSRQERMAKFQSHLKPIGGIRKQKAAEV